MDFLFLSLDPSPHYPEHCQTSTEIIPPLKKAMSEQTQFQCAFETLPFLWKKSTEEALKAIQKHSPKRVYLLSNEPNNMEIVLSRFASSDYETQFPDNNGNMGEPIEKGLPPQMAKSNVYSMLNQWTENPPENSAHVSMTMAGTGTIEAELFYNLLSQYEKTETVICRLGVPPIAPEHEILKPENIANTLCYLVDLDNQLT